MKKYKIKEYETTYPDGKVKYKYEVYKRFLFLFWKDLTEVRVFWNTGYNNTKQYYLSFSSWYHYSLPEAIQAIRADKRKPQKYLNYYIHHRITAEKSVFVVCKSKRLRKLKFNLSPESFKYFETERETKEYINSKNPKTKITNIKV